jgi:predicted small integral membrane protein
MDTTFPGNQLKWRAISSPVLHHLFYGTIIVWETASAVLCWAGAFRLLRKLKSDRLSFHRAKSMAVYGLVLSMLQWLLAFLVVGGEWFLMWQSARWNGQDAAFRMFVVIGLTLLFVSQSWDVVEK